MFHTARKALGTSLATALALGPTVAPGALAQPIDRTPDARGAPASTRLVNDLRSPDARDAAAGHDVVAAGPPTWPSSTQPIPRPHAVVDAPASGFDWGSAIIGAATVVGALAIAFAGLVGLRHRRIAGPGSLTSR
jgi:hypothetical protein